MVLVLEVFLVESVLSSLGPDHGGSFPASLPLLAGCQILSCSRRKVGMEWWLKVFKTSVRQKPPH
jgi:hypothetical protein